ncbi:MAG: hypothetical protein JNL74_06445 [Fibrobacteres bacterium]|nr:hypothetical protein [Fibrobacterota bacterium]
MQNPTWVESQWSPSYIAYDFWTTDSLFGYQSDENGERIRLMHSTEHVNLSRWHGKHLYDKSNPIFKQF